MKQRLMKACAARSAAILAAIAVMLSCFGADTFAYGRIDTAAEASLTAVLTEEGTGIDGAAFRLYRVADVSDTVEFTLAGDFADAPVSLEDVKDSGGWADMAATLSAYAAASGISPIQTQTTKENGTVSFSGLKTGLYLLSGDGVILGEDACTPAPAIIMLPTLSEDDTWDYAPCVEVKYTKAPLAKYQDITVKKVWDDGGSSDRPDSVKVQLLRDRGVYETVVLNADNNWTYTWSGLPCTWTGSNGEMGVYTYAANESDVPREYTVSVGQNGSTFTVKNTSKSVTDAPKDPTLPQTGTLNWPIPVLTVLGLLLVCLGWYLFGGKKKNRS